MHRVLFLVLGLMTASPVLADAFLDSQNGRIHYQYADGRAASPVILVHGFSTPMWVWQPLYAALQADGRSVLRFDLYGRGGSERAPQDSLAVFHAEIDALRSALDLQQPADLVGLSMGGAIVASYAAQYPDRVRRVALLAPFNQARRVPLLGIDGLGEWLAEYVLVPIALRWGYRNNFADAEAYLQRNPGIAERFTSAGNSRDYSRALLSSLRNIIVEDQLHWYRELGAQARPVMLVWGEGDRVLPYEQSQRVRAALGEARFLGVPGAGHLPHLERADVVVPAIVEFLK